MNIRALLLLSLGHLVTDLNQGILPVFTPYFKELFKLSYVQVGVMVAVSNLSSSIVQPFFGLWSDRRDNLWILPAGCFIAGLGMALAGLSPNFPVLLLAVLMSGLGIAAYHPEASKTAYYASGQQRGSSMAVFSIGGNIGIGLGPVLAGLFLMITGLPGAAGMVPIGGLTAALLWFSIPMFRQARQLATAGLKTAQTPAGKTPPEENLPENNYIGLVLLVAVVTMRSWIHAGLTYYIPMYYQSYLGAEPALATTMLFLFLISGAVGTLFGGWIADRIGPKNAITGSMGLMLPLIYLFRHSEGVATMVLVALIGGVLISTFAVTIVLGQQLLPRNIGVASGFMTGFGIGMGGIGMMLLGLVADRWLEPGALLAINLLALPGLGLALLLPGKRKETAPFTREAAEEV
ncbi:hypothetical protein SY88_06985 [Clostridiales bacterium PH28_bin88]|nr:hypothetical protein SY88_06985 [Clostridiales bacterium PH28_bin88]